MLGSISEALQAASDFNSSGKKQAIKNAENSRSYQEWLQHATTLDRLCGVAEWKADPASGYYDYRMILHRTKKLKDFIESKNVEALVDLLRGGCLARNFGNINNPRLYQHGMTGTKYAIRDYLCTICDALDVCAAVHPEDQRSPLATIQDKIDFFIELKHIVGHTALLFSGGASAAIRSMGVIKCFSELKLLPRIYCGSSTGSFFAALLCAFRDNELEGKLQHIRTKGLYLIHADSAASDPHSNLLISAYRTWKLHGFLINKQYCADQIMEIFGDLTFLDAYKKTGRVLNITVSREVKHNGPKLLNHITAPNVLLWSAIVASSTIPIVFNYEDIYEKDEYGNIRTWDPLGSGNWVDGSIENDLPVAHLTRMFSVKHSITVQNNFFCVPLKFKAILPFWAKGVISYIESILILILRAILSTLSTFGVIGGSLLRYEANMLDQKWFHDVTISPEYFTFRDLARTFMNADPDFIAEVEDKGKKCTWSKFSMIQDQTMIEHKLDEILYRLKCNVLDLVVLEDLSASSATGSDSSIERHRDQALTSARSKHHWSTTLDILSKRHETFVKDVRDALPMDTRTRSLTHYQKSSYGAPVTSGALFGPATSSREKRKSYH